MRIAILTSGRFHVLDLARELVNLGHDVRFHSLLNDARTRSFGLPDANNRWVGPLLMGAEGVRRKAPMLPDMLRAGAARVLTEALDAKVARVLQPCDVFIGMAGMSLRTMKVARRRYGAMVICERASQHIVAQKRLLMASPGRPKLPPKWAIRRNLAEYAFADRISVPARHAVRSFIAEGVPAEMLIRNPFGTDLDTFRPTVGPPAGTKRIIMVGTWSLQKGCDVLVDAWRSIPADQRPELLHVGQVGDAPLPSDAGFKSLGFVPQATLLEHYKRSSAFVLASRQEGLAVVQVQALAAGLPVICTDNSGGEDLKDFLPDPSVVTVVPHGQSAPLRDAIAHRMANPIPSDGPRDLLGDARPHFSWAGYAKRWDAILAAIN